MTCVRSSADLFLGAPTPLSLFLKRPVNKPPVYLAYRNYPLNPNCRPWPRGRAFHDKARALPIPVGARRTAATLPHCFTDLMYWDRVVAMRVFGVAMEEALSHNPHLWERHALTTVERRLNEAGLLEPARRNRFRDARTDISWHPMFESLLAEAEAEYNAAVARAHVEPGSWPGRMPGPLTDAQLEWQRTTRSVDYIHEVMRECGTGAGSNPATAADVVFDKLDVHLDGHHPHFVAVDDELHVLSVMDARDAAHCLDAWQRRARRFFERHWPHRAPWERP